MTTRTEVNLVTGEIKIIPLTQQELNQAKASYDQWMLDEEQRKQEQIQTLESQLAILKGTA